MITQFLGSKNAKPKSNFNLGQQQANGISHYFNGNKPESGNAKSKAKNPFDKYKPWIEK
jgi:hypothetical protein